jgi:uncharacterized caspase-like protein
MAKRIEQIEELRQSVRQAKALADVLFSYVGQGADVESLMPETLGSYTALLLEQIEAIGQGVERVSGRAAHG